MYEVITRYHLINTACGAYFVWPSLSAYYNNNNNNNDIIYSAVIYGASHM